MALQKAPDNFRRLYVAAVVRGGEINVMSTASRRLLKAAEKRKTTEADLERMRLAQAKRDRRAQRNARNAGVSK
jgi:hypothetical protein